MSPRVLPLFPLFAGIALAFPPEVRQPATPGEFRDPETGLALRLPGGFGFLSRQGTLTVFGSRTTPGVIFLEAGENFTEAELEAATREGYQDEGVTLRPAGAASRLTLANGAGLVFPVEGTLDGQAVRGLLAGLRSREGRCFILLAATTPEAWPRLAPAAGQLAAGISLSEPVAPDVAPEWKAYFGGKRLSFYFNRASSSSTGANQGSLQSTERLYLCPDGTFFHGEQTQATFDLPQAMGYSRNADNSVGRWSAAAGILTLSFHDGRVWHYRVTRMGNDTVYLNGSRYFRSGQDRCR